MRIFASLAAAILLVACTPMPPLNFSVPNVGLSAYPLDAEVRSLTVTMGRPDEQTGPIDWEYLDTTKGASLMQTWETAMQEALDRSLIFRDGGAKKVSISVKILELDLQEFGFSMTSDAVAKYEIIDRMTGDIIYTQNIVSTGTVEADYAYLGAVRMLESANRAVQNNIALFLQAAETINLDSPMFPAGSVGNETS